MQPDFDVIVIGYGPVGETCANLLGYYKIKSLIIEKDDEMFPLPRAITWDLECKRAISYCDFETNVKTRRIRALDNLDAKKRSIMKVLLEDFKIYNYQHEMLFMHQPQYDEALRKNAEKYQTNTIKKGYELIDLREVEGIIHCKIKNCNNGQEEDFTCKYLLACDGANSKTRKLSNIPLNSLDADETWMVVDGYTNETFECFKDVDAIQYCNPSRPITIIQGVDNIFRFEIAFMPGDTIEEIQKEEVFSKYLDYWIGGKKVTFMRKAVYSFHAASAEKWKTGNIFLLGDAAHQMPPFMGQGMNSGCRDAENLLWKINGVLKGIYSENILETYESERKPHVDKITRAAITMGNIINAKSHFKAFLRNATLRLQNIFRSSANLFPAMVGTRLGKGIHKAKKIKNATIERYYFNIIKAVFSNGNIKTSDELLGKNFGLILNDFKNNLKISEANLSLLKKHNFKIINFTENRSESNFDNYISCKETHDDMKTYCERYDCNGVIVRPDKYVYDLINYGENDNLEMVISKVLISLKEKIDL
jgi:3-(3-hydroxy-phenyl)propionate hydroxylase